jgi:hypothetical protein
VGLGLGWDVGDGGAYDTIRQLNFGKIRDARDDVYLCFFSLFAVFSPCTIVMFLPSYMLLGFRLY